MEERDKESIQEIVLEDSKDKETKIGRGDQRAGKLHEKLLRDVGTPLTYQVRRGERSFYRFRTLAAHVSNSYLRGSKSQKCPFQWR